jgi:hypothetical protein
MPAAFPDDDKTVNGTAIADFQPPNVVPDARPV